MTTATRTDIHRPSALIPEVLALDAEERERRRASGELVSPEPQGLRGRRATFTAMLEAGREPHFGFFSRPTKASLVFDQKPA